MSLVEIVATLQLFTVRGSGGMLPQEILAVLRRILVHSAEKHMVQGQIGGGGGMGANGPPPFGTVYSHFVNSHFVNVMT